METRRRLGTQTELCCRGLVGKFPARTPGNEGQAFSVARAGGGMPVENKKARSVVALSRVPRLRARGAGSPPAASHGCRDTKLPSTASLERDAGLSSLATLSDPRLLHPLAAVRPLVRIPTD